ncbi:YEATS-associated helix-containing protein [Pseudoalteromonas sp. NGC95]|uniref:YEATS-associated helix-containing protein n=1 Tax=Pseudoalteromonas sp. NGC95 TaxID=2792051 RepID=UPI0018CF1F82|nr:YEATS-associated helix-containing protein [Pseudoalteromonas sp. NGC95]MBH0017196.1 hypothetical protein [Pseudoalteromonas sp. NGC95]
MATLVTQTEKIAEVGLWIHSPFILMLLIGLLGGWLSWLNSDYDHNYCHRRLARNLITGVLATFMVPLFLQMIGSSLLKDISPIYQKFYVFLGMCSAAAFVSQKFATSISEKLLQKANDKADHAEQTAKEASEKTYEIANEHLMLQGSVLILKKQFNEALVYIDKYLQRIPEDSNVLWRKAYCLKRLNNIDGALDNINKAIEHSKIPQGLLFYNQACYRALLNQGVEPVIESLRKALELDPLGVTPALVKDLREDFKSIKDSEVFLNFLKENKINKDK